jgi:hypothetical protein
VYKLESEGTPEREREREREKERVSRKWEDVDDVAKDREDS